MTHLHSCPTFFFLFAKNKKTQNKAGGEAALMPSPTRTITPAHSPVQTKRKLETTVSMENAAGAVKKKEKPANCSFIIQETTVPLTEETPMETEDALVEEPQTPAIKNNASATNFSQKDMEMVGDMVEQLMQAETPSNAASAGEPAAVTTEVMRQKTVGQLDAVKESPEEKDPTKVIKKFVNKHKTADLVNAIGQIEKTADAAETNNSSSATAKTPNNNAATVPPPAPFVRKCSLQDETPLNKFNAERRKSRILETAEKFQQMNNSANNGSSQSPAAPNEKPKKIVIPGVSVGSYKKEFERKASATSTGPTAAERRALEQVAAAAAEQEALEAQSANIAQKNSFQQPSTPTVAANNQANNNVESSDSKNSVSSLSLEDARRSMENSIALLKQAQSESNKEVDQLCAKTENIGVSDSSDIDRERKLKNARAIIGNAIQPGK